jgi:hypothetical protein
VRPIAKPFLFLGTILFGIFLLLFIAANLTLQLPGMKDRIRKALTSALGTPVSFERLFLNPIGGIRLGGVVVSPNEHLMKASAEALTIYPLWGQLLKGELSLGAISLEHPLATVRIGSTSSPTLPSLAGSSFPSLSNQAPPPIQTPHQTDAAKSTASPDLADLLPCLSISHGEFSLLDANSHPVLQLKDIKTHGHQGVLNVMATTAIINDSLILHGLAADAQADTEGLSLSLQNISATMGEGRVTGTLRCGLPPKSPDYSATLQLTGAALSKLLADASFGQPAAEGKIDGDLTITGTAGSGATMTGKGSLCCKEAVIEPVAFLKQIGQLLNVDELKLLKLAEGKCLFRIDGGRVVIDELFLRSENLILSAKGPVQSTGELDLESRLLFNQNLAGRLHGLLGSQLTPAPEPGYSQVTFHVKGPASNPRTDLIERLTGIHLGGNLGGLGGLLQGLFGKPAPQPQSQPQAPSPVPAH